MLRWLGHDRVAVLDGGLARWVREGHPIRPGKENWKPTTFAGRPREGWRLEVDEVASVIGDASALLVDARSNERFHGMGETLDPVAGHIPGAANYFYQQNLALDQRFKSPEELRSQWAPVLQGRDAQEVVVYCGSGVSACHNLLALEHAGLKGARIYPGSWSEWCADPQRPVET
jgi:thiosulfate/3-mercaptopyruvate sulfurtransferase